jgi:hypothetical protein
MRKRWVSLDLTDGALHHRFANLARKHAFSGVPVTRRNSIRRCTARSMAYPRDDLLRGVQCPAQNRRIGSEWRMIAFICQHCGASVRVE